MDRANGAVLFLTTSKNEYELGHNHNQLFGLPEFFREANSFDKGFISGNLVRKRLSTVFSF